MILIKCQNERFTYDMYHIVKSFFPDADITQTVDEEQESLITISIGSDSCFLISESEEVCFQVLPEEIENIAEKREQKRYINKKLYCFLKSSSFSGIMILEDFLLLPVTISIVEELRKA